MWERIWKFETARFTVDCAWEHEECPDLSWADDDLETLQKLNSGEWTNCTFRIRVLLDGREVGTDYLGNSVYADPREFVREHYGVRPKSRADGCYYGTYFTDMVLRAIHEARTALVRIPKLREVA